MHMNSWLKWLLLGMMYLQQLSQGHGARILAPFIFPSKSHFSMSHALIRELVQRGHEVTFITPFSLADENLGRNYTEILIPQYNLWNLSKKFVGDKKIIEMSDVSTTVFLRMVMLMGIETSDFAFEQPGIKELIHEKNKIGKYDLLLAEQFYTESTLIFSKLYEIPVIVASTFGYSNYMSQMTGIVSPWSYVPHNFVPFTDHMTFIERVQNTLISAFEDLYRVFIYQPAQNAVLRKHFSHLPGGVPTVKQLERNISALLLNSHMPLTTTRPTSYNMIPVGGLHITLPKSLPAHIQKFMDEAKHGVIYFSLGTQVRSADMSPEKLKIFLNVFSKLKQRVLWKFEDEKLPNLPKNVMVQAWMPQSDILAHKNVKVFITHGGQFGTQEGLHYGVPMLGMPVYCDQHLSINIGKAAGYALGLDYRTITEENLSWSLLELLEKPEYKKNAARASRIFRDRPLSAMDTAMYWIDYVIEHRGAPHLVAAGVGLPWYQFYLLDIIAFGLLIIVLPIFLLIILMFRKLKNFTTENKFENKLKKN